MNCDDYRRMFYLYRQGELSNREAEELVQHLHSCESCRLEQERISAVDEIVQRIRSYTPVVEDPRLLTSAIMSKVRSAQANDDSQGILDKLLDLFALPQVRIAASAFVVLVTGTFLFQYLTLFTGIHSLELSAGLQSTASHKSETLYSVESPAIIKLAQAKDLQDLIPAGQYKIVDRKILVNQNDVSSLLSSSGLRSLTSAIASSVLHVDKKKLDAIIEDVSKNYTTVTTFGQ
jgi:hypothetical protein